MTSDPSSPSSQRDPSSQPGSPAQPSPADPSAPGAAGSDADADRLAAASPATPAAELARIAAARPDLHPALAANPATYPDLVDWLRTSPDPAVQTALARRTTPPAQPEPTQAEPAQAAQAEAPARAADAPTNPPPAGAPAPTTKTGRRTGLPRPAVIAATVLVTVLVLVGATGVGLHFLSSKGRSQSGSAPTAAPQPSESPSPGPPEGGMISPDPSWADGAHEVWSLDGRMITTAGDQLFVAESGEDGSRSSVAAYSISGSEPEKQWEAQVHGASMYSYGIWGDYLTVGHQLIERSDGRVTEAPWSVNPPLVAIVDDMAIACDEKNNCEAWRSSDISSRAWSATIEGALANIGKDGVQAVSRTNTHVGDRTILALSPKMLVDVDTGETFDLSAEGYRAMSATTDGWVAYNGSEYALLSPTGEKRGTFGGSAGVTRFTATPSQERPSGEQYRRYLEDGDLSWAEVSVNYVGLGADGCEATIAVGRTIVKGKVQSISNCLAYPSLYIVSDDEKILVAAWEKPFSPESASIMGAWTIADQKPIEFPGSDIEKNVFRLAGPSLMISSDSASGRITAYAPGKK